MMALHILPLLQIIIIFCTSGGLSYPNPLYGAKRYGRSNHRTTPYEPSSYEPTIPSQRYPLSYYKMYPYSQSYPEEFYYPQDTYPVYYTPPRTSKYESYHDMMPYYYENAPVARTGYGYYGYNDPANVPVEWQEEMLQEAEREEREEAQPIGHESYYENENGNAIDTGIDDANAAFLQNLILTQMYQDSLDNEKLNYQNVNTDYEDSLMDKYEALEDKQKYPAEDETVKELKQLPEKSRNRQFRKQNKLDNDIHWSQTGTANEDNKKQRKNRKNKQETKRSENSIELPDSFKGTMVYTDRKPINKLIPSSSESSATTQEPKRDTRGQKEEFQMRPATPVRHPFSSPVLAIISRGETDKKRAPSVYDTIKHMLDMERNLEHNSAESDIHPAMRKRIITPEENLARQLTVLKKTQ